jgi:hypothetical protein
VGDIAYMTKIRFFVHVPIPEPECNGFATCLKIPKGFDSIGGKAKSSTVCSYAEVS